MPIYGLHPGLNRRVSSGLVPGGTFSCGLARAAPDVRGSCETSADIEAQECRCPVTPLAVIQRLDTNDRSS